MSINQAESVFLFQGFSNQLYSIQSHSQHLLSSHQKEIFPTNATKFKIIYTINHLCSAFDTVNYRRFHLMVSTFGTCQYQQSHLPISTKQLQNIQLLPLQPFLSLYHGQQFLREQPHPPPSRMYRFNQSTSRTMHLPLGKSCVAVSIGTTAPPQHELTMRNMHDYYNLTRNDRLQARIHAHSNRKCLKCEVNLDVFTVKSSLQRYACSQWQKTLWMQNMRL